VVAKARGLLGERRVGHAGTLDPDATGVLLLGVGSATRLLRFLSEAGKQYTGEVVLGASTDTLDASGNVTATFDMASVTLADVRAVVASHLLGPIEQVPPMVSALKVDGRRLHELAREGVEVERASRPVTIARFDVEPTGDPLVYRIDVACSSGTYVRSLADDLGRLLGGGAHLRSLRRTAVGSFTLAEAGWLDTLQLLPPEAAVRDLPSLVVDDAVAAGVRHGRLLEVTMTAPTAVFDATGTLLAVYEPHRGRSKPAVVVAEPAPRAPGPPGAPQAVEPPPTP
jgi:tRNA pseudouridine55 synthase